MFKYGSIGYKVILFLRVIWDMLKTKSMRKVFLYTIVILVLGMFSLVILSVIIGTLSVSIDIVINNWNVVTKETMVNFILLMLFVELGLCGFGLLYHKVFDFVFEKAQKAQEIAESEY